MLARSRIAVILDCKKKSRGLILTRENEAWGREKMARDGEKPPKISQLDVAGTGCMYFSFSACFPEQETEHSPPGNPFVPFDVSCASPLKGSSLHRWGELSCAFPGMPEQIEFFRVVSFCPKLQRTALQGYSNSDLSRGNHV